MRGIRMELGEVRRTGQGVARDVSDLAFYFIPEDGPEEGVEQGAGENKGKESEKGKEAETEAEEMDQTLH